MTFLDRQHSCGHCTESGWLTPISVKDAPCHSRVDSTFSTRRLRHRRRGRSCTGRQDGRDALAQFRDAVLQRK